jgi:hypothetical protein
MTTGINFAGEYHLKELLVHTSSGNILNLTKAVQSIDIFEDMFSTSLSGSITILDVDNIAENGPVIGQEYMTLKITTPSLDEQEINFTNSSFAIYKVTVREAISQDTQLLALSFISPELLRDKRVRVSKSYTDSIDRIVESVLTDARYINTNKDIYIEPTAGIRKIVCPNLHPYAFINNLTQESLTSKSASPYFFFFENLKGIHFKSLDRILSEDTVGNFNVGNITNLENKSVNIEKDLNRALTFEINSNNDMLLNIQGGMLGSSIIKYNIYNKSYEKLRYNYFTDFEKFDRIDENPLYNTNEIDEFGNNVGSFGDARIHLHPTTGSGDLDTSHTNETSSYSYAPNKLNESILFRRAKIMELNNAVSITMKINGNTTIAAGQTINLTVPVSGRIHEKENDEYYSGRYLITKLRHSFSQTDKKHEILLTASKDSFGKELPLGTKAIEPKGSAGQIYNLTY